MPHLTTAVRELHSHPRCRRVASFFITSELSLALIGNASAQKFPGRRAGPEAFSIGGK